MVTATAVDGNREVLTLGRVADGFALRPRAEREQPAPRERQTGPDEHDAADTGHAGNQLTGQTAKLARVREAKPAARLLTRRHPHVGLPAHDLACAAINGELRAREAIPMAGVADRKLQRTIGASRKPQRDRAP